METSERFYVVTKRGSIYEVEYNNIEISTSVKKIFSFTAKISNVNVGYELFPEGKFVAITRDSGLCKYNTKDGKKGDIENFKSIKEEGTCDWTSPIIGLFHEHKEAVIYYIQNFTSSNKNWFEDESCQDVLESIGYDHPVIGCSKELIK